MNADCDIAIIGGGPVGSALRLALRDSGLRIVMLEARRKEHAGDDPRALALSCGSRQILERLGVWREIAQVSPIRDIHVSQKGSFGRTLLRAAELEVPALGYVLPYTELQNALNRVLQGNDATCLTGAAVTQLQSTDQGASITYQHDGETCQLQTRLAVVADGGKLLEATHPPRIRDYHQSAVITHVTCAHPQPDTAFERFTAQGPLALLPFRGGYELVWTAEQKMAQEMLAWPDAVFLARLHQHFGDRVGEFLTMGRRTSFPLCMKYAPDLTLPHTVLIGNAAQTLHPVAGQGFNLGLRDSWELAQEILDSSPGAHGSSEMLSGYCQRRRLDRLAGTRFTDGLVSLFSNDLLLVRSARAAALTLLDCLPGVKKFVARRMMFGTNG